MSGVLINDYSNSDSNILAVQSTLDKTFFGKIDSITLTEFDSSTIPAIAAGSVVECNGAIYSFSSEESISTTDPVTSSTVADGTCYVLLVPGTGTITAAFTATAPTWSDSKQGWYGTGDEANYRYVGRCLKASTSYDRKKYLIEKSVFPTLVHAEVTANVKTDNSVYTMTGASVDEIIDVNNEFAYATGIFSPDTSGFYKTTIALKINDQSTAASNYFIILLIEDNGVSTSTVESIRQTENDSSSTYLSFSRTIIREFNSDCDYYLQIQMNAATGLYDSSAFWTIERVNY